jgi:hypothetical protein
MALGRTIAVVFTLGGALAALLSSPTLAQKAAGPVPAKAPEKAAAASGIELADGSHLDGTVKRVDEKWVEVDVGGGGVFQLAWDHVRADRLLEKRRALMVPTSPNSVKRFADWCREAGLVDEARKADGEFLVLVGGGSTSGPDKPTVAKPNAAKDPGPSGRDQGPSGKAPPPGPGDADTYTGPKAKTVQIVLPTDASAVDNDTLEAVKTKIAAAGVKLVTAKPEMKIDIATLVVKIKKHVTYFGATVFAIAGSEAKMTVTHADGKKEEKTFQTGDHRSNKTAADAQKMARDDLISTVFSWLEDRCDTTGK